MLINSKNLRNSFGPDSKGFIRGMTIPQIYLWRKFPLQNLELYYHFTHRCNVSCYIFMCFHRFSHFTSKIYVYFYALMLNFLLSTDFIQILIQILFARGLEETMLNFLQLPQHSTDYIQKLQSTETFTTMMP